MYKLIVNINVFIMKSLSFFGLVLCVAFLSCQEKEAPNDYPFYDHILYISFQDASGNDLVKGIEFDWFQPEGAIITEEAGGTVKPDLFTLEYVFPDGRQNPWKPEPKSGVILEKREPVLGYGRGFGINWKESSEMSNYDYFGFEIHSTRRQWDASNEKDIVLSCPVITIRLSCPYLFGNDAVHDIVTYWEPVDPIATKCYRVEFAGKEYIPVSNVIARHFFPDEIEHISVVTVTLE